LTHETSWATYFSKMAVSAVLVALPMQIRSILSGEFLLTVYAFLLSHYRTYAAAPAVVRSDPSHAE
jgi:hypothetical protein